MTTEVKKKSGRRSALSIKVQVKITDLKTKIDLLLNKRVEIDADISAAKSSVAELEELLTEENK